VDLSRKCYFCCLPNGLGRSENKVKLNINPFNTNNPMTFKEAAIIATITAAVIWILTWFANITIGQIREDLAAVVLDAVKTYAVSWAGTFISLTGLEEYIKRTKKQ